MAQQELLVVIDATLERLRREFARGDQAVSEFERKVNRNTDRVQQHLDRMAAKTKTVADRINANLRVATDFGGERRGRDIEAYGRQLDQLRAKYNPLFAAQQRYEAELNDLNRALKVGAISQQEYAAALGRTQVAYNAQVASLNRVGAAMVAVNRTAAVSSAGYRQFGMVAQQAGFQVGDFAVQVASGQRPMVAFTQQAAQLLGFFGPWGAVLGAAAAVVGGLWLAFDRSAEAAEDAAGANDLLNEAIKAGLDITQTAEERSRRLATEREREATETFRAAIAEKQLNEARLASQRLEALESLNETELALERMSPNDRAMAQADPAIRSRLERDRQEVERLTAALEEARRMTDVASDRFSEFLSAPRSDEGGGGSTASRSVERVTEALRETADPLQEYIRNLGVQNDLLRLEADERERVEAVMRAQNLAMAEGNLLTPEQIQNIRDLVTENQRLRDTQTEIEDVTERTSQAGVRFGNLMSSAFEDAIIQGEGLRSVLAGLLQDFGRMGIRSGVNSLAAASSGFFGDIFGSAKGNVFSRGDVAPFAAGGAFTNSVVASPTVAPMALFGEAGPEAIMPLKRGPDGKLGVAAPGGGGMTYAPVINVDARNSTLGRGEITAIVQTAVNQSVATVRSMQNRTASARI